MQSFLVRLGLFIFQINFIYFLFLLQKIEHNVIKTRAGIITTVNNFNEILELHGDKRTERGLILLKNSIKFHEDVANDKDENGVEYLIERNVYLKYLLKSFLNKYNINRELEEPTINNSTFIETPDWIKNKKCTINLKKKENNCFQYSIIASLYHKEIKNNPERISKIKPFINNLNWENVNVPPEEQDYNTFEMNNKSIVLNVLQVNEQKISRLYKSEFNKTRERQAILLMIRKNEKQHYFAVKRFNSLLKKRLITLEIIV